MADKKYEEETDWFGNKSWVDRQSGERLTVESQLIGRDHIVVRDSSGKVKETLEESIDLITGENTLDVRAPDYSSKGTIRREWGVFGDEDVRRGREGSKQGAVQADPISSRLRGSPGNKSTERDDSGTPSTTRDGSDQSGGSAYSHDASPPLEWISAQWRYLNLPGTPAIKSLRNLAWPLIAITLLLLFFLINRERLGRAFGAFMSDGGPTTSQKHSPARDSKTTVPVLQPPHVDPSKAVEQIGSLDGTHQQVSKTRLESDLSLQSLPAVSLQWIKVHRGPVSIGGVVCNYADGNAYSVDGFMTFAVPDHAKALVFTPGIEDGSPYPESRYSVLVDGEEVKSDQVLRDVKPKRVQISLTGAQSFKIKLSSGAYVGEPIISFHDTRIARKRKSSGRTSPTFEPITMPDVKLQSLPAADIQWIKVERGPVSIGGVICKCADGDDYGVKAFMSFKVPSGAKALLLTPGIRDGSPYPRSNYAVLLDGDLVKAGQLYRDVKPKRTRISVQGARSLKINLSRGAYVGDPVFSFG